MRRIFHFAVLGAPLASICIYLGCQTGRIQLSAPTRVSSSTLPAAAGAHRQQADAAPSPAPAPSAQPQPPTHAVSSIPIVELRGSGTDLGRQHGLQLRDSIRLLHDRYLGAFITGDMQRFVALTAAAGFSAQLSPAHREEVTAMADACGLDPREAMLGQCFLDLSPMTACSTVALPADAAPDHVARFGRNLDFPSLDVADKYSTLFIVHPQGKYAFASIGWPGLVGVLSGMNEHGLTIANMEVTRSARLPHAMPYTLLYRTILEQCRTTQEALDLLRRTPRQTANNLMIMDATGDRAVAEISPEGVTVRTPDDGALVSTNHRRGADNATPGRCVRYDHLRAASAKQFGHIGAAEMETMLAEVSQEDQTLQSMIFEPSTRVVYLSIGKDAARGRFENIDLKVYFGR